MNPAPQEQNRNGLRRTISEMNSACLNTWMAAYLHRRLEVLKPTWRAVQRAQALRDNGKNWIRTSAPTSALCLFRRYSPHRFGVR
jgi:hypothetical protein